MEIQDVATLYTCCEIKDVAALYIRFVAILHIQEIKDVATLYIRQLSVHSLHML